MLLNKICECLLGDDDPELNAYELVDAIRDYLKTPGNLNHTWHHVSGADLAAGVYMFARDYHAGSALHREAERRGPHSDSAPAREIYANLSLWPGLSCSL
jgi:hypothetical protein